VQASVRQVGSTLPLMNTVSLTSVPRPPAKDAPSMDADDQFRPTRPLLSVVVPVYNQAGTIVENVRTIRERVEGALGGSLELIVVSDGSIDQSEERLLEDASDVARVIHYDRNLGKGFAVKAGALAAAGQYISYVDSDLDLDPAAIPRFVETAQRDRLDFVIGSKRHPDSVVHYPAARRVSSWLYQQLVRLLFRLDVRDTQVGLKVFRRDVADEVMPLLLVKQYAFDLELLAVARALGFDRLREMPITLRYQFTGSGVRSIAVLFALVDTAAIFYRLRILRYYQRKRALLRDPARRYAEHRPRVTVVTTDEGAAARLEYPDLEVVCVDNSSPARLRAIAERVDTEVIAVLGPGTIAAGNWLDSTIPFLARPEVAAVVVPTMTPADGSNRELAAGAVWESRLGGGSLHFRFTPGNLRFVKLFPAHTVVVRRADYLALAPEACSEHQLVRALTNDGRRVVYTPDTVVVRREPPLFGPHLAKAAAFGRGRGRDVRRGGPRALRPLTLAPLAFLSFAAASIPLAASGPNGRRLAATGWALYGAAVALGATGAGLRFHSARVGGLTAVGSVATHLTYGASFLSGFLRGSRPHP
jgi:glycosyltransferase involved in cell wall biosynthesis